VIDLNDVQQLMTRGEDHVLSLYLRVDPAIQDNQAATPAWKIYAKNALKEIDEQVSEEDRAVWKDIHDRAENYLRRIHEVSSKGLVLFYGPDFDEAYNLPVPPLENSVHFGRLMAAPLLWLLDEYEPYLVVLVDSEEAQFLKTYLGEIDREEAMASDRFLFDFHEKTIMPRPRGTQSDVGGQVTAGSHRDEFADKMDEYIAKFHRDVAERVGDMLKGTGAKRVVLGGIERAAHAVYDHLHESVRGSVVGVLPIPLQESDHQVMKRMLPAALDFERKHEKALIDEVTGLAKSGGRGALGREAIEAALKMGQVELLIVPWPPADKRLIHDLTVRALKTGSKIELVHGEAADKLKQAGGVAARLYYAIKE
jgi:peptide subunit release factor 1 (eRF1)